MKLVTRALVSVLFCGLATTAQASPAIWEVSDGDSKIWLFGSVHLLPSDIDWRTQAFDKILQSAGAVYFETDISPDAQMALTGETFRLGINDIGEKLTDSLNASQSETLTRAAKALDTPMGTIEAMKPWLAATTLSVAAVVRAGYDPASGVDNVLEHELPKERQRYFETGVEQIGFLAGAPPAEQIVQLIDTASRLDEVAKTTSDMVTAWAAGEPEQLSTLFLKDLAGYDAMADRLIYARNRTWVLAIKTLLAQNEQDLIVVGTGHLIGDKSVVELLSQSGFAVKRVQ